ncbi:MAG: AMP-binding protein [Hyphomicrobiales bacterium]
MSLARRMIEPEFTHDTIAEWLSGHSAGKTAIIADDGRSWTYGELNTWSQRLSGYLSDELVMGRGDRIAYLGPNDATMIALLFACARIGAILVPMNWRLTAAELSWIIKDVEPHALVYDDEFAETALEAARGEQTLIALNTLRGYRGEPAPQAGQLDDPLLIVYTSGTTGRPKGAVLDQRALYVNALSSVHMHTLTADDTTLVVLPLFHVGGLNISLTPTLYAGATVILHRRFEPQKTLDTVENDRPDILVMVPATMTAIMALPGWKGADLSSLRMVTTGSMIVPPALIGEWEDRGISIVCVYGSTETCPIAGYTKPGDGRTKPHSTGHAALHSEIRIDAAPGEEGEIQVRGGNVMSHYWRNEEETEAAYVDGWFRTGDIGYLDADGHLIVCDRIKNMIISGGENIYPAEVEQVISSVDGVEECCVVGLPHEKWGETPAAAIVLSQNFSENGVRAKIEDVLERELARFKHPRIIEFTNPLPRNAMGKVVSEEVRKRVDKGAKSR